LQVRAIWSSTATVILVGAFARAPSAQAASAGIPTWQPPKTGVGYEVDLDRPSEERPEPIRSREVQARGPQPLYVRIQFSWDRIETERGDFHFEDLERTVSAYQDAGFETILAPRGGNPLYSQATLPAPTQIEYLTAWKTFLRKIGERFRGRVRFYQVADAPDRTGVLAEGAGAREYAYLVKTGAVEIRSADAGARIVLGSIGVSHLDFLEKVLREDLGPYLDAVPLRGEAGIDPAPVLQRASEILLHYDPAASLWLVSQPLPEPPEAAAVSPGFPASVASGPVAETGKGTASGDEDLGPSPVATQTSPAESLTPQTTPSTETQPAGTPLPAPAQTATRERGGTLVRTYAAALAAGSRLTLFDLRRGPGGPPELSALQVLLRRVFLPTLGPSSEGTGKIGFVSALEAAPVKANAWRFFDTSTFQVILVYAAADPLTAPSESVIILDTADVTGAVVDDLLANTEKPARSIVPEAASNTTRVTVPLSSLPLLLRYQRFATPGFLKKPESVEIGGKGEITAEEIIAHHQEFQSDQDTRLHSIIATGRISYHYKVADADITVDVTTVNNFYWDRRVGAEWEEKEFYFNGVRWKGKKPPELPLIQPEKVVALPLDINLNRDYTYRYLGLETADGRECYVLEFAPVSAGKTLYEGKVWIDRRTFARVRITSVQTGLSPPVISNDEKDSYSPAPGAGVNPIWVLQRIEGQQIFATAGVNLVVLREVEFSDFVLNAADFEPRRQAAYDSAHTILRDTEKGFRYLDRTESGGRVVRDSTTRSTTLGLAGVFYEKDLDFPVPLAGINHFDFNFRNSGAQINLFFAGALILGSIQNPHLFGTRLDAGASVFGIAFSGTDNFYLQDRKVKEAEVRTRTQSLSVNAGYPLGNFFKVKATGSLDYAQFGHGDDTASFDVPIDTTETSAGAEGEFNRKGYTMRADVTRTRRSRWDPWGDTDPASPAVGTRLTDFDPTERSYTQVRGQISKQFILPLFQKLTHRGQYLTGKDLDRFSKYRFNFFGNRLRGFSGSGVRFDRGVIAAVTYSFNLADVIRFDATLDHARVRDTQLRRLDPLSVLGGYQDFSGFGLSGNLLGPWSTVIQFDYGLALQSDIPGLRGDQEIELLLLKFF